MVMDYPEYRPTEVKDLVLAAKIEHSLEIIRRALAEYGINGVALSFNGGKDCCVLLHLLYLVLARYDSFKDLRILYFVHANTFPEVDEFVHKCIDIYNANITFTTKPLISALNEEVNENGMKAIFMGTRSTDPRSSTLKEFAPTDTQHGWPAFMRVNPILNWNYEDVWKFMKELNVPYCVLYDKGYTSIGSTVDTVPNPALKTGAGFDPAYKLLDGSLERAGRMSG